MRSNLTILMKENEQLKRELERKNQKVDSIQGKLNQNQIVVSLLQKIIDKLRKNNKDDEIRGFIKKDDNELSLNNKIKQIQIYSYFQSFNFVIVTFNSFSIDHYSIQFV
ncbi:unnamed protein product (macronuclear) [Paramecium tetraurelia]|uniref:Uncharacterized protein n=1 Tax=Paramecium tetraurelia TaxID=5888 RepID=A0DNS2_PARTE|nr:uncharacterized protein GSPATT00018885001 [Paramecium tetraurelia]CAK84689.1 unnamed protein product [Paramecium tetraurelia]|eukprot:XP_001452086.1 hypothetical protein (macronuclear) [Paramecium tetraurelia strain d4-2]